MMRPTLSAASVVVLSLVTLVALTACVQPPPTVLCVMRNPQTGATATMYKEIPFKVPANYDEQKHIAQWKQDQIRKGFSVEVTEHK